MEKYILLDAIVAEIKNKIEKYIKCGEESEAKRDGYGMYWVGVLSCLNAVRKLCDTLEIKLPIKDIWHKIGEANDYLAITGDKAYIIDNVTNKIIKSNNDKGRNAE